MKTLNMILGMMLILTTFAIATSENPYVLWDLYRGDKEGFCEYRLNYETDEAFCSDVSDNTIEFYPMYEPYIDILNSRCVISTQHLNFCGERPVIYTLEDIWNANPEMCEHRNTFENDEVFCQYIEDNTDMEGANVYDRCIWIINSPRICGE